MYQSPKELYPKVVDALQAEGFSNVAESSNGRTCYTCKDKNGKRIDILVQVRRYDSDSRYTIGIAMPTLKSCDFFIGWMQGEKHFYIIPREFLFKLFETHKDVACFTKEQWRVDFYPDEHRLKVQGAAHKRYDISIFAHNNTQE